jgi:predicted P-loop ATPase/GTPase
MPLFKVILNDRSFASAEIDAPDAARVFSIVQNLDCKEADVLHEGAYAFSIRLSDNGLWYIFQRGELEVIESIQSFG